MPSTPRQPKAEEIFRGIMGEPHNVSRKIPIKKKPKTNPNGDVYGYQQNNNLDIQKDTYGK